MSAGHRRSPAVVRCRPLVGGVRGPAAGQARTVSLGSLSPGAFVDASRRLCTSGGGDSGREGPCLPPSSLVIGHVAGTPACTTDDGARVRKPCPGVLHHACGRLGAGAAIEGVHVGSTSSACLWHAAGASCHPITGQSGAVCRSTSWCAVPTRGRRYVRRGMGAVGTSCCHHCCHGIVPRASAWKSWRGWHAGSGRGVCRCQADSLRTALPSLPFVTNPIGELSDGALSLAEITCEVGAS